MIPSSGQQVLEYNLRNNTVNYLLLVPSGSSIFNSILYFNKNLYFIPWSHNSLVIVDTNRKVFKLVGSVSGTQKFSTGVIVNRGNYFDIFFVPYNHQNIMYYSSLNDSINTVSGFSNSQTQKWSDQVLVGNQIFQSPFNTNTILVFDVNNFTWFYIYLPFSTSSQLFSSVIEHNNRVYFIPSSSNYIVIIDVKTYDTEYIEVKTGSNKFLGQIKIKDKLYLIPHQSNEFVILDLNNHQITSVPITHTETYYKFTFINNFLFLTSSVSTNLYQLTFDEWNSSNLLNINDSVPNDFLIKDFTPIRQPSSIVKSKQNEKVYYRTTTNSFFDLFYNNKQSTKLKFQNITNVPIKIDLEPVRLIEFGNYNEENLTVQSTVSVQGVVEVNTEIH